MSALIDSFLQRVIQGLVRKKNDKQDNQQDCKEPPIRVDSTLHLAWGLTLSLSHDEQQNKVGDVVTERYLKDIRDKFQNETVNDRTAQSYLDNLATILSAYLRSMGFEKGVYDNYLDVQKNKRDQSIRTINDLADLTSFSNEGIVVRIASFLGFGSVSGLATNYFAPSTAAYQKAMQTVENLTTTLQSDPSKAANLTSTIQGVAEAANKIQQTSSLSVPAEIGWVMIGGFLGLLGVTLFIKWISGWRIQKYMDDAYKKQQKYWETVARPNYIAHLVHLFEDIKDLVKEKYPDYYLSQNKEAILKDDRNLRNLYEMIENLLPREVLYVESRFVCRWNKMVSAIEDNMPGIEDRRLKEYLKEEFHCYWIDNCHFTKNEDEISIIDPVNQKRLSIKLDTWGIYATLCIDGRERRKFQIKRSDDNIDVYENSTASLR